MQSFHPAIQAWFAERFPAPTEVQREAWPRIAQGGHLLATAPTGSGKTLAAFLWSLNRFARGDWPPGRTRVLYVSPLKALNNDIRRNLLGPLGELSAQGGFPDIQVRTRSGDTPQSDRQRMLRQPPDILITTPESLTLLLTSAKGRQALSSVETLILDEVHAVAGNRRGVQLMTSVERLARLAGEFQRIALSATVRPLPAVAAFVGGCHLDGSPRPVDILASREAKRIRLRVRFPEEARNAASNGRKIWDPLADSFRDLIEANRSTLFFVNSRSLAEKIVLKINQDQPAPLAYAHHGSLARDIRAEVERRLKAGELKAIVATSSLELGIDIGHLDEVALVQSPPSVAAALQRIGRAGHRVGEVSAAVLYPTHGRDFLEAAALAGAVAERDIEPLAPLQNPLDVLCQTVLSMCATETWKADDMFALLRTSAPYRRLPRNSFDLVLDMLAGRYAGSRVRELKPRIAHDRIAGTVRASKGARLALYSAGGTIPDRGYYQLRHADSNALIGELDEEFVWEASAGQSFALGAQSWQIARITHNDVLVRPARPGSAAPPFWRGEDCNRSFHFSQRIGEYLESAEQALDRGEEKALKADLMDRCGFEELAAGELIGYLARQRSAGNAPLPHRRHLLLELVHGGPGGYRGAEGQKQLVIHTFWGGAVNRPWALALEAAWRERFGSVPEIHADNDALAIQLPQPVPPEQLLEMATPANLDACLRQSLEGSGCFGARFRECADRALLLSRQRFDRRLPLWMSRLQAKKLMSAVREYRDFPILLEAWRSCLADEFDLPALKALLGELSDGSLAWSLIHTRTPSPFAAQLAFGQIGRYMYADDAPERSGASALGSDLIRQAVNQEALRPRLRAEVVAAFEAKRQRRAEGYQPQEMEDWLEWAKERVLIPAAEWPADIAHERLVLFADGDRAWIAHLETAHALAATGLCAGLSPSGPFPKLDDPRSAAELAAEMLSFYGPRTPAQIEALLPRLPEGLLDDGELFVQGRLIEGSDASHCCDADNLEALLRLQRAMNRTAFQAKPAQALPGFWAQWQGFGRRWSEAAALDALEQLSGCAAPVQVWLQDFMECRFRDFEDHLLDQLFAEQQLAWTGAGQRQVALGCAGESLLHRHRDPEAAEAARSALRPLFADPSASYGFQQLCDRAGEDARTFSDRWWQAAWLGALSADSLIPLRTGLKRDFRLDDAPGASLRRRARATAQGWPGNWRLMEAAQPASDPLEKLEQDKEQVRALAERYGVLSREIVNREARWGELFKALRIMELAGELLAGHFFKGLSGPQFISPQALSRLQSHAPPESFWLNATDPASPCGLSLDWDGLPARRPGNYLSFIDGRLALSIENNGARLRFHIEPNHPKIDAATAPLQYLARRRRRIAVQTINGIPARQSPYLPCLDRTLTRTSDHKQLYFEPG